MPFTTLYTIPDTQIKILAITPSPSSTHIFPYYIAVRSNRSLGHSTSTAPIRADLPLHRPDPPTHNLTHLTPRHASLSPCASHAVSDVRSIRYRYFTVPFTFPLIPSTEPPFPRHTAYSWQHYLHLSQFPDSSSPWPDLKLNDDNRSGSPQRSNPPQQSK